MVTRGKWNVCFGAIGIPESGKTTWAVGQLIKIADHNQCYVVAHDPDRRIPPELPDGREVRTYHYGSAASAAAGLKQNPTGIHCIDTDDAMDVVNFGVQLAAASLKQHGGDRGVPVMIYLDEAIKVREMGPHAPPHKFLSVVTGRRWLNVGIVWGSQSPQAVHNMLISQGNELAMFKIEHRRAIKNLEDANVPLELLEELPKLRQYECKIHKFGFRR